MTFYMIEKHSPAYKVTWGIKDIIHIEDTPYQKLAIIDTVEFGKALVLDDALQTTVDDEFYYHEMIAHVPLFTHPNPRHVLIIGGGDGGTALQVLKHKNVEQIDLVEIDEQVIKACIKYLPELSCSFADPRVNVIIADGINYVGENKNKYDVIIIDSTDPEPDNPALKLYSREFYQSVYECLKADGLFVAHTNTPSFAFGKKAFKEIYNRINACFPLTKAYIVCVPSYISGYWSFTIGSKLYDPQQDYRSDDTMETRFYTSEIHKACFVLPRFMHELIAVDKGS
ncbi:MAG: polyamine aminopropyltransferase [Thermacetogeniaceae bacterium]